MGLENILDYTFSPLFAKHEFAKECIFTIALQNDKSNPVFIMCGSEIMTTGNMDPFNKRHLKFGLTIHFHRVIPKKCM